MSNNRKTRRHPGGDEITVKCSAEDTSRAGGRCMPGTWTGATASLIRHGQMITGRAGTSAWSSVTRLRRAGRDLSAGRPAERDLVTINRTTGRVQLLDGDSTLAEMVKADGGFVAVGADIPSSRQYGRALRGAS